MSAQRYTLAGDAALEVAISDLMSSITSMARPAVGLESLLLGGSLGRGEATVRHEPSGDRLASDVEVYLVGRPSSLRAAARRLEMGMAGQGMGHVSAAWLHPTMLRRGRAKNLSWRSSRTIRLYELASGSRTLLGGMPRMASIDPTTLPLAEGVRLLLNRLAEAGPELGLGTPEALRWLDKTLIACGDILLLAQGQYTVRYRDRMRRVDALEPPWPMPDGWRPAITSAYQRKLEASGAPPPPTPELTTLMLAVLGPSVMRVAGISLDPLRTFPQRYVLAGSRCPELLRYLPPLGPAGVYEGLVLLARAQRAGYPVTSRALRQAVLGRPLSLALQAAALPLSIALLSGDHTLAGDVARSLRWAGLSASEIGDSVADPRMLADLLRRRWMVAT